MTRTDNFEDRRREAIDHHFATARAAIMALRGFGEHAAVVVLLDEELADTRAEAASIMARRDVAGGTRTARQPLRLVGDGTNGR